MESSASKISIGGSELSKMEVSLLLCFKGREGDVKFNATGVNQAEKLLDESKLCLVFYSVLGREEGGEVGCI